MNFFNEIYQIIDVKAIKFEVKAIKCYHINVTKSFSNQEISELLEKVAAVYTVKKENRFKIAAYQEAASSIEHLDNEIKDLWEQNQLTSVSGIGKNISSHLDELFKTGKVKHWEELFDSVPKAMFSLMKIPGIGPNMAFKLSTKLKLKNPKTAIADLQKAAREGKIKGIETFGEKSEREILQGIDEATHRSQKMLLYEAKTACEDIIVYLKKNSDVLQIDTLGSLRRQAPLVGDIDISVASNEPQKVMTWFIKYPKVKRIIESGERMSSVLLNNNIQIDLRVVKPESYGSLLQHFTGSKQHNIHLREFGLAKGLSLSEYGIRKLKVNNEKFKVAVKSSELIKFKTEKEFYNYLGMEWIPPELREDNGEIEASLKKQLPKLVEIKDIKADFHLHSNFDIETSHDLGINTMEEVINKAKKLNYYCLAFSEHNPSISQHKPDQIIALLKRKKGLIDKLNYSENKLNKSRTQKMFIFNSLEIDIRPDGSRAVADECLQHLDYGMISIHSSFRMGKKEMTQRILKAFDHPKIKIYCHPTGRLLKERNGFELDWEKLFAFIKKNNKFIEINSYPNRLDPPDTIIKLAKQYGVRFTIGTDSHQIRQMDFMEYGVAAARRGWLEKSDIINTYSIETLKKLLMSN